MQFTAPPIRQSHRDVWTSKPSFNIVAIHDGFVPGIRAQEAVDWLDHSLRSELHVSSSSWSFRNLERVELRAVTLREAAEADVIIVAGADSGEVPEHVKRWLEATLQKQREGRAVLVDLHEEDLHCAPESETICTYLNGLADRWRTDLMCNGAFDKRLNRDFAMSLVERKRLAVHAAQSSFGEDSYSTDHRWGLNE